jgi:predicted dienelactone hydrolase
MRRTLPFCLALTVACTEAAPPPADSAVDAPLDAASLDAPAADVAAESPFVLPADVPTIGDPRTWDARQRGPFRVGHRILSTTYTPRGATAPRTIALHVWYPTHALDGPHPVYQRAFRDNESISDAPLAPTAHGAMYPVQVYSHGDRGFPATSHFLMRFFATHGWVSIAPEHVGNTLADTPMPRRFDIYHLRAQDVRASLDRLAALPAGDPLVGRCDTRRVVLSAHSFGAHTVWSVAGATYDLPVARMRCTPEVSCTDADLEVLRMGGRDERVVAAIPMAGSIDRSLFGPEGHRSVRIPLLAMSGTADRVGADTQFASTAPVDLTWIDVRGGCHQYFALGGCPDIPDSFQDTILSAWSMAFARRHVLNDDDATVRGILDHSIPLSDRVAYQRRSP